MDCSFVDAGALKLRAASGLDRVKILESMVMQKNNPKEENDYPKRRSEFLDLRGQILATGRFLSTNLVFELIYSSTRCLDSSEREKRRSETREALTCDWSGIPKN